MIILSHQLTQTICAISEVYFSSQTSHLTNVIAAVTSGVYPSTSQRVEAWVCSPDNQCGNCGRYIGTGIGFWQVQQFFS